MNDKKWLIRTKNKHILGPLAKDKLSKLYNDGSIKMNDEVCLGNGYWFAISEKDLVDRFLVGDEKQEFDVVSEVSSVLGLENEQDEDNEVAILPCAEDLEYPDVSGGTTFKTS